jgi:zinc ribbon protein
MFCPRCGAQNRLEQKFCRNCGLSLPSVRLALEGKVDEAAVELKQSHENLGPAVGTLGFFILAALGNALFGVEWGAAINLILGALITIGWFHKGFKQMNRVLKTLEGKEREGSTRPAIASANQPTSQAEPISQAEISLPSVPDTDPILAPPAAGSIAEHTTFELKKPEPR